MSKAQFLSLVVAGVAVAATGGIAHAARAEQRPGLVESFRIGSEGGALCQVASRSDDTAIAGMFDRAWSILCRDSAVPVGTIHALRPAGGEDEAATVARTMGAGMEAMACAPAGGGALGDGTAVTARNCTGASGLTYRVVSVRRGRVVYVARALDAYAGAMDLGLRSILADRIVPGRVDVASIGGADAAGFARLQSRALDPHTVLAEGYRRNASGNYAEAAEFFDSLTDRLADPERAGERLSAAEKRNRAHEYTVNRALQMSNLGEFDSAAALFRRAHVLGSVDPVQMRLARNFEVMHRLNQRDIAGAGALLAQPLVANAPLDPDLAPGTAEIDAVTAAELNGAASGSALIAVQQEAKLTVGERIAILDAQSTQLRGTLARLSGDPAGARAPLQQAYDATLAIREGRVSSLARMRAQILAELALTHEAQGDMGTAEALLRRGVDLLAASYPETVAMNGARARLAAFLARQGRTQDALDLYRLVTSSVRAQRHVLTGLSHQMAPYFALLARDAAHEPARAEEMFTASQLVMRPGAADTMETLVRALSGGEGDAARLFRQSVSLARDIERARIALARLTQAAARDAALAPQMSAVQAEIDTLSQQQVATLSALSAFPQYRAVTKDALTLDDLRAVLRQDEAYLKLSQINDALYAVYADGAGAVGYRLDMSAAQLDATVEAIRATISADVGGVQTTYALDVDRARALFVTLLGPVAERLPAVRHIIFEPDGAMLQLPLGLLIAEQAGVDAYKARVAKGGDEFDFRAVSWVARTHAISTALSARAFRDARQAGVSSARRQYLGLGENAPVSAMRQASLTGAASGGRTRDCQWPESQWGRPISAAELKTAAGIIGADRSLLLTGAAFTDDGLQERSDLSDYRIVHFATHGLVTAPLRECPARPALVTSFGATGKSDGLLEFAEIFDLRLDADLVILSACDTAGKASLSATREAGLRSGGGGALDGLVRAFIGAGSRSVIASHWPAPDDFKATERLIGSLFTAPAGMSAADAMQSGQRALMDEADTSHPFYWAGFAIVGDGARPVLAPR